MNDAMYIAATGMQAQQQALTTVSNNLANVNTSTFKAAHVNFADLVYRAGATPDTSGANGIGAASGVSIGNVLQSFTNGELRQTGTPTDIAINGAGFLEVNLADGTPAYSRGGSLQVNADGLLCTADGQVLKPGLAVGQNLASLGVASDGTVSVTSADGKGRATLGRLDIVNFSNPAGLSPVGNGLYRATENSGDPVTSRTADALGASISQGYLEASNVDMVQEMVNLMIAQRAYGLNVKVVQAADEIASMVNQLRK